MTADLTLGSEGLTREKELCKEGKGHRPYHQNPGVTLLGGCLGSCVETLKSRDSQTASQKAAQLMCAELTGIEAKMKEMIQTYGRKTREVGCHRDLEKERNNISNKLYKSLRRAQNQGTTRDTDGSFSRPEGGRNNLERVAMPKFGGKPKG